MPQELLTLRDVEKILRVNYARAAELARQGLLPVVRIGRQVRIDPAKLEQFIARGGQALAGGWRREP